MNIILRLINLFLLISSCSLTFAQTSATEQKIIRAVDKNMQEGLELVRELININSGTLNFAGVKKVGSVLKEKFDFLGLETIWIDGTAFNRAGHLIIWNKSKNPNAKKLLLIGHLDTVFEPSSPFQNYKMLNDSIMQGPGIGDMKGGDVIIYSAMQALKDADLLDEMNIKIVFIGDEESSGKPISLSRKDLIEAAEWADIAIGFENGDGSSKTIVLSRRGFWGWALKVKGNAAHSSQIFTEEVGVGSIYETSRILNTFYEEMHNEELLTFNPGTILGGTDVTYHDSLSGGNAYGKLNIVSQQTIVHGDLRTISPDQLEKAKSTMRQIVANNLPGTSAVLEFSKEGYPPLAKTKGNVKFLKLYNKVSLDLGFGEVHAVNPLDAGAADISFTSGLVEMAVDGLGLPGEDSHTIKETGDISKISVQAKRAAVLMYRLTK